MENRVYLDYAATTPLNTEVYKEMLRCFSSCNGNSSSLHSFGREASGELESARATIAKTINAKPNEIYFTSCGTESNNWAIFGLARANKEKGNHIIVSSIEHHSILESCKQLEKEGFQISYIPITKEGVINYKELVKLIRPETILISVMTVNNELGTIQPIKAIGQLAKSYNILFHTDAVQALGSIKLDVEDMGIDALSISAHKIYGPKGVACLYIKNGTKIEKLIYGGEQERNMRAGTVNVPACVGFAKACEIHTNNFDADSKHIAGIKRYFEKQLASKIKNIQANGKLAKTVNNIINIDFRNVDGEAVLMLLDLAGVAVSTGSACVAGVAGGSHVISALDKKRVKSSVRFSFSYLTTKEEIDYTVDQLAKIVANLRQLSPVKAKKEVK